MTSTLSAFQSKPKTSKGFCSCLVSRILGGGIDDDQELLVCGGEYIGGVEADPKELNDPLKDALDTDMGGDGGAVPMDVLLVTGEGLVCEVGYFRLRVPGD